MIPGPRNCPEESLKFYTGKGGCLVANFELDGHMFGVYVWSEQLYQPAWFYGKMSMADGIELDLIADYGDKSEHNYGLGNLVGWIKSVKRLEQALKLMTSLFFGKFFLE